jgi:hypothetical protein
VTLVKDAWSANEHMPAILAGTKPPVFEDSVTSPWAARTRQPTISPNSDRLGTAHPVLSSG